MYNGVYMTDFAQKVAQAQDLTIDEQKKAGAPIQGKIGDEHKEFLKTFIALIDSKKIDPSYPKSFLKKEVYDKLDEEWKDKTDLALINIGQQVRMIYEYHSSKETPNDAPQLQTMVEQLWQMKQRIEEHYDCFVF